MGERVRFRKTTSDVDAARAPTPRRTGALLGCALALLTSASALAEKPRIALLPFGHPELERQLRGALCAELSCISPGAVTAKGRVDWRKVTEERLTGVMKAKIARDSSTHHRLLDVEVLASARVILVRRKVPLSGTTLSTTALRTLQSELVGVVHRAHGPGQELPLAPAAADVVPALPSPAPPPAVAAPALPPVSVPLAALTEPPPVSAASAVRAEATPELGRSERSPSILEVQPALGLLHRSFEVSSGTGTAPTLRSTTVPTTAQPGLSLAFYPLRSSEGLFASLGLEGSASASVGMQVQRENDPSGTLFPATSFGASLALRLNLRLGSAVTLGPVAGWQLYNFDVHPTAGGEVLTGQPAVHWRAWAPGLKLDLALGRWALFAEARYLYIYSVGPLQSGGGLATFSAAPSFDTAVGFGFQLTPEVQLRLEFAFARYAITVPAGASAAQVSGVSDQLLGGTLAIRYHL